MSLLVLVVRLSCLVPDANHVSPFEYWTASQAMITMPIEEHKVEKEKANKKMSRSLLSGRVGRDFHGNSVEIRWGFFWFKFFFNFFFQFLWKFFLHFFSNFHSLNYTDWAVIELNFIELTMKLCSFDEEISDVTYSVDWCDTRVINYSVWKSKQRFFRN